MLQVRVLVVLLLASACAVAIACQSIVGLKEPLETVDPCVHLTVPEPPAVDDDPAVNLPGQWFAVRNISLTNDIDAGAAGYDLDGVCSCQDGGAGFRGAIESCQTYGEEQCDLSGGVDNSLRKLIQKQAQLAVPRVDLNSLGADDRASKGLNTIMVYIGQWNGKPNDKEVYVGTLVSQSLIAVDNCDGPIPMQLADGGSPEIPMGGARWNGCDRWTVAQSQVISDQTPIPAITTAGYVRDGVVTVNGGTSATLAILGIPVSVRSAKTSFRVTEQGIDGTLAGRLDPISIMKGLGSISLTTGSPPICETALFGQIVDTVCGALDIAQAPATDFAARRCDGLSAGVSFRAVKVPAPVRVRELAQGNACANLRPETTVDSVCNK